jgi:hypothetical protein
MDLMNGRHPQFLDFPMGIGLFIYVHFYRSELPGRFEGSSTFSDEKGSAIAMTLYSRGPSHEVYISLSPSGKMLLFQDSSSQIRVTMRQPFFSHWLFTWPCPTFHQSRFAVGSSIREVLYPTSHNQIPSKFPGKETRVHQVRRMNSPEALLSAPRKSRDLTGPDLANNEDEVLGIGNGDPRPD